MIGIQYKRGPCVILKTGLEAQFLNFLLSTLRQRTR